MTANHISSSFIQVMRCGQYVKTNIHNFALLCPIIKLACTLFICSPLFIMFNNNSFALINLWLSILNVCMHAKMWCAIHFKGVGFLFVPVGHSVSWDSQTTVVQIYMYKSCENLTLKYSQWPKGSNLRYSVPKCGITQNYIHVAYLYIAFITVCWAFTCSSLRDEKLLLNRCTRIHGSGVFEMAFIVCNQM